MQYFVALTWKNPYHYFQVFLEVLGIEGEEHEGTWERVQDMFDAA